MIEHFVDIETADGAMNSFVIHPDEDGPHPVILFLMDAPGMRDEIRDMCSRLASVGYYVVAGNLYYRRAREWNRFELGGTVEELQAHMASLTNDMVVSDAGSMIGYADADEAADASRVGTLGYCMSGPFSLMTAARYNERVKAAASMHGVKLATDADDSPHRHLEEMNAEVYVAAAELDQHITPEEVAAFSDALEASSTTGRVEWYPGTDHGFTFAGRGPIYDKAGSERHWERLHSLFHRNLRLN